MLSELPRRTLRWTHLVHPSAFMLTLDCDWEPSSHNTARIQIDEFGDGYFSAPALTHHKAAGDDVPRLGLGVSKDCANPFARAPLPWLHDAMHIHPGFM